MKNEQDPIHLSTSRERKKSRLLDALRLQLQLEEEEPVNTHFSLVVVSVGGKIL